MADSAPGAGTKGSARVSPTVITDARVGSSREMASREKRYAITMGIRTACFVSMIFVTGPFRWVLLAGAIFLPYIAVVLANQANTKTKATQVKPYEPVAAPAITRGDVTPDEVLEGELVDVDEVSSRRSGLNGSSALDGEDDRWTRHDRVA